MKTKVVRTKPNEDDLRRIDELKHSIDTLRVEYSKRILEFFKNDPALLKTYPNEKIFKTITEYFSDALELYVSLRKAGKTSDEVDDLLVNLYQRVNNKAEFLKYEHDHITNIISNTANQEAGIPVLAKDSKSKKSSYASSKTIKIYEDFENFLSTKLLQTLFPTSPLLNLKFPDMESTDIEFNEVLHDLASSKENSPRQKEDLDSFVFDSENDELFTNDPTFDPIHSQNTSIHSPALQNDESNTDDDRTSLSQNSEEWELDHITPIEEFPADDKWTHETLTPEQESDIIDAIAGGDLDIQDAPQDSISRTSIENLKNQSLFQPVNKSSSNKRPETFEQPIAKKPKSGNLNNNTPKK